MKQIKASTLALILVLTINFATAQKIYKKIQGEYENPIIGDITIKGYELTYKGYTHIYQTESDNDVLDNYVYYKYPEEEGTIGVRVTRNGTKYLTFSDGEYILIPKDLAAQEDKESKRKIEAENQAEIEHQRVAEQKRIAQEQAAKEAKRKNLDALMGGLSDHDGKVTGDPNASGYYGIGGDGSGGNYRLGNRKALSKPKPNYPCNEEGKIVVGITVDQSGRVIDAQAGMTGSTNSAPCLLKEAKEAALKARFNADSKAPSNQVGAIIYNFSLSE